MLVPSVTLRGHKQTNCLTVKQNPLACVLGLLIDCIILKMNVTNTHLKDEVEEPKKAEGKDFDLHSSGLKYILLHLVPL